MGYEFKSRIISFTESLPFSILLILLLIIISIRLKYYNSKLKDVYKLDNEIYDQVSKLNKSDINRIKSMS